MHIPDGFLDPKTIAATSAFSLVGVARALRDVTRRLAGWKIPLMGVTAAFVFVAQMLNFPVAGGTSGHFVGGVFVAVLLGPSAAVVVITVVLLVQCFLFADGGVFAIGANIFNMAIVSPIVGYSVYRIVSGILPKRYGNLVAIGVASWVSTVVAAICCTGELVWSGTVPWSIGFPAMAGIHMLIGFGEGLITMLVYAAIMRTRPDLVRPEDSGIIPGVVRPITNILIYGFLIIFGLALFVSPFASRWPDGLEKVAAMFGFASRALSERVVHSPIAEYKVPGIGSFSVATALAGAIGAITVFLLSFVLARFLTRSAAKNGSSSV